MDKYKVYLFEYPYKGDRWGFEIMATSPEDAVARFKAIPWGRYSGELLFSHDVCDDGLIYKFINWFKKGSK
jgi:hypothetical protein